MDQVDIFLSRVDEVRKEKGFSVEAVSKAGGGRDLLRDAKRRHGLPKTEAMDGIAAKLEVTVDWLLGKTDQRNPLESNATLSDKRVAWRDPSGRGDLPIYGTALGMSLHFDEAGEAEIEQTVLEPTEVIKYLTRPAALRDDPHAYAFYVQGDSMVPAFKPGKIGVATTRKPPEIGDNVIVQLIGNSDGEEEPEVVTVLIKELVKRSGSWVELRQYNPPATFRIERARIRHLHRVIDIGDLLGG